MTVSGGRAGRLAGGALAAGLIAGTLAGAPVQAAPDGSGVVIDEIYVNGGSSGATYVNKYVELLNPTTETVDVSGWSVQYRSATGTADFSGVIPIDDHVIPPGGRLLVSGNSNAGNGDPLPEPDVSSNIAFSGSSGGTLALASSQDRLTGAPADVLADADLVDLVGYGSSVTYEGSAAAPTGYSVTTSLARDDGADTDDNAADLALGEPDPVACGTACDGGGGDPDPEPDPEPADVSIAEIQGTGDASPLDGRTVTTRGVVTAAYPTGGFDGVYLQTAGTGTDPGPASTGVFVFGSAIAQDVEVGDHVEVTGEVSEYFGLTEVTADTFTVLSEPAAPVVAAEVSFPLTEAERERLEGMLLRPQGGFTVTNNYLTNQFGEIGLAAGDDPLPQPTDVARPLSDAYQAVIAENDRRAVTLDDGASLRFTTAANTDIPLPWLRPDNEVRVGAPVGFVDDVVLDYRFSTWRLQPTDRLEAGEPEPVTIGATRTAAPEDVGGDVRIASFNVLNYFTTTGEDYEAAGLGTCTYYTDRAGNRTTVNRCSGDGPRGAADEENLQRQQVKIVAAVNAMDADVVSLEEIENSAVFGLDRDTALDQLVIALNADAGSETWAAVPSPARVPEVEDVIRTAFIHRVDTVEPVGESAILQDPAFDNARDPLAQEFRPVGGTAEQEFVVIVNHFKSKGSGSGDDADQGDGQGASNASRVRQAEALVGFAGEQAEAAATDLVFLGGDFNAYTEEDPLQVIEEAGYVNVTSELADGETYQFDGRVGSLDHVFASAVAADRVTGADIWDINADEAVAREYSRYNANITPLYAPDVYRASDHDPEIVGVDLPEADRRAASTVEVTRWKPHPKKPRGTLRVRVDGADSAGAGRPTGEVTVTGPDGTELGSARLRATGRAKVRVDTRSLDCDPCDVTVAYSGDDAYRPVETSFTLTVP